MSTSFLRRWMRCPPQTGYGAGCETLTAQGVGGFRRGPLATVGVGDGVGLSVGVGVGVGLGVGVCEGLGVGVGVGATTCPNWGVSDGGFVVLGDSSPDANTSAANAAARPTGTATHTTAGTPPRSGQSPVLCEDRR